jgi:Adenosine deaminase
MIKSLAFGISTLLKCMPIDVVIHGLGAEKNLFMQKPYTMTLFDEETFASAFRLNPPTMSMLSESEATNIFQMLQLKIQKSEFGECGFFSLFYHFSKQYLYQNGYELVCRHSDFASWKEAIHGIGQTPFICSYLAAQDLLHHHSRTTFDYSPYLKTDDFHLRQILARGVAENHFHLKGSSPSFLMNWICLMNHTENRRKEFAQLSRILNTSPRHIGQYTLHELVRIAAGLRSHIWEIVTSFGKAANTSDASIQAWIHKDWTGLQRSIDSFRSDFPHSLDYTLDTTKQDTPYAAIAGENFFQYNVFYALYQGENKQLLNEIDCVYAYFMIYCMMRSELLQDNLATGFVNFLRYQDRKELFIEEKKYSSYSRAFLAMAFESALGTIGLKSLEIRIAPKNTPDKQAKAIDNLLRTLAAPIELRCNDCENYNWLHNKCDYHFQRCYHKIERLSLVMHIPKTSDGLLSTTCHTRSLREADEEIDAINEYSQCRHSIYRKKVVDRQINSILGLRRVRSRHAQFIYAIDACSTEIGCRPEVFAPAFRRARRENVIGSRITAGSHCLPPLHITYHVGEDFLDIVDGLRAIDEAIRFLDLRNSDRLGHALALGVSAKDYYGKKGFRIFLPRQDLLDNAAWLYMSLQRFNIHVPDLFFELREIYREQYNNIYAATMSMHDEMPSIEMYYDSWKLRGDEPSYYLDIDDVKEFRFKLATAYIFDSADIQKDAATQHLRDNDYLVRKLYHLYHYYAKGKNIGAQNVEYIISPRYAHAVELLQRAMQMHIANMGIGIECNPSSNYLIGSFRDYAKHPMFVFNNDGLEGFEQAAQLLTSINTDDQGIFDTDLESEYALMSCALKNMTNKEGAPLHTPASVYKYINKIRKIGLDQSFRNLNQSLFGGESRGE